MTTPVQTSALPDRGGILDPQGKPARVVDAGMCPGVAGDRRCGAGKETRVASTGFGQVRHPICSRCGHEFHGEVWHD